jgi:hypothetical protein
MSDELATLQGEFPRFRIWQETIHDRVRYVARSTHTGLNPHTVVTEDLAEVRAALEPTPDAVRRHAEPANGTAKHTAPPLPGQRGEFTVDEQHRQQGAGAIERRLFQRMQALEDAVAYRHARAAAPCPDCALAPGPRCDDHGRDLDLIGEYLRTIHQTAGYLHRIHTARLRSARRPAPVPVAATTG